MKKLNVPHVSLGAQFAAMTIAGPTDIVRAETLVDAARQMWFKPDHRQVVTDGLKALMTTVDESRATGKRTLLTTINNTIADINAQSPAPPAPQNGAGDEPHRPTGTAPQRGTHAGGGH